MRLTVLGLLILLIECLSSGHDAQIVLRMLEVVFRVDILAGRNGITRQLQILVGNCLSVAANFYVWTVAFKHTIQRIGLATTTATVATATSP